MNCFIAVNPDRCIGCGTCEAACSDAHRRAGMQGAPRLALVKTKDVSAAVTCHHCADAPCLEVCPVRAVYRSDRAVRVDEQRCIGCKLCAIACPYGAITPSGTSVAGVAGVALPTPSFPQSASPLLKWEVGVTACAVKCDLCETVAEDLRCIASCLTGALTFVDQGLLDEETLGKRQRLAEGTGANVLDAWKMGRP